MVGHRDSRCPRGDADGRHQGVRAAIVTGVNTPPVLESAEHGLDLVALALERGIGAFRFSLGGAGGDGALREYLAESVGIMATVPSRTLARGKGNPCNRSPAIIGKHRDLSGGHRAPSHRTRQPPGDTAAGYTGPAATTETAAPLHRAPAAGARAPAEKTCRGEGLSAENRAPPHRTRQPPGARPGPAFGPRMPFSSSACCCRPLFPPIRGRSSVRGWTSRWPWPPPR